MSFTIKPSTKALNTRNLIREVVDEMEIVPNPDLKMIPLSIGDPTVFGNLNIPDDVADKVHQHLKSHSYNGYTHSMGYPSVREALAAHYTREDDPLTADDILITSGASGAVEISVKALAEDGDNILAPRPGFSLYQTVAGNNGVETRYYDLNPDQAWQVDLDHLASLIDDRTRAIVLTNPSNPCGSNYSKEHLQDIVAVAEKHQLPIIADEIYEHMTFDNEPFVSVAQVSQNVPCLVIGGLAKRYLVPGWRIGWIRIHDRNDAFADVRTALLKLSQLILGASTAIQSVIPYLLTETPQSFYDDTMAQLQDNAQAIVDGLADAKGLTVIVPRAAMYVMTRIDLDHFPDFDDDSAFSQALISEQSVFVLPGKCFLFKGYFRIVFCAPRPMLEEACTRIQAFCDAHYVE